jgi:hypothetical protein
VHIIGGMGTGKTHLARRLAAALDAPLYEMDLGVDTDAVVQRPSWVTEGIYLWAIDPLLGAADAIVWLDLPYRTCLRRIIVRHATASLRGTNRHKGLRNLWSFASGSRAYWKTAAPQAPKGPTDYGALSRVQTMATLAPHEAKVHRFANQLDVNTWLDEIWGSGHRDHLG